MKICKECAHYIKNDIVIIRKYLNPYFKSGAISILDRDILRVFLAKIEKQTNDKEGHTMTRLYKFSRRSFNNLRGVHPDLVACVVTALYRHTIVDFAVIEGVRTMERQRVLVEQGASWTLNSKHLPQSDGFSHAVDLAPWIDGKIPWEKWGAFDAVAEAMVKAAESLGVSIEWGGNWATKKDGPHFQLVA